MKLILPKVDLISFFLTMAFNSLVPFLLKYKYNIILPYSFKEKDKSAIIKSIFCLVIHGKNNSLKDD
jgi:ABC-type uncharacterized transport system permease subunit